MEKSSRNILLNILWPAEKENRFGMTWDSVNYDRLFILGWIVPFIPSVLPHSPSQTFILFISLLFLAAVCQNTLSSTLFHPHCSLSLTHSGHYVKRCGPLDGRQCNQLIKSCFDHQHQHGEPQRLLCDLVESRWPSQWPMSCDLDRCLSIRLFKGWPEPCYEFLQNTGSTPWAFSITSAAIMPIHISVWYLIF